MKNHYKFWWHFDRAFGDNKLWILQIVYVILFIVLAILIFYPLGLLATRFGKTDEFTEFHWIVSMIIKGKYVDVTNPFPFGFQVIMMFVGSFVFSGIALAYINNLLTNRMKAYNEGTVRYHFGDHILFLGGSKMILPMIKEMYNDEFCRKRDIVILADESAATIRRQIADTLNNEEWRKMKITVLRGFIDEKDSLRSVHVDEAARIYIIGGKPSDTDHDSVCMACWNLTKQLCGKRRHLPCLLMFDKSSSAYLFRRMDLTNDQELDTTLINRMESVAQRTLVVNGSQENQFPALDRNGIGADSQRTVHMVLYGMTEISFAMATTAAQLCHFPNFVNKSNDTENLQRRTKITFIAPNIKEEMAFMTAHLDNLFSHSKVSYIDENGVKEDLYGVERDNGFGNFLDIEWEFVNGNIADGWTRALLQGYYQQNLRGENYLTLVLCQYEADKNIAAALYLPREFHTIYYLDEAKTKIDFERTIPIFVFQPENEELLKTANAEIKMYKNTFSFGSIKESYDPSIRKRIAEGKRINYIYDMGDTYREMSSDQDDLDQRWRRLTYTKQLSNIYSSMHIGVKQRSLGGKPIDPENEHLLTVAEHNRWNMEKLLAGYGMLPEAKRNQKNNEQGLKDLKDIREKEYLHYCIAPFNELTGVEKSYDLLIVKHMNDII